MELEQKNKYLKKDLKKIIIISLTVGITLIILSIVNFQTNLLTKITELIIK